MLLSSLFNSYFIHKENEVCCLSLVNCAENGKRSFKDFQVKKKWFILFVQEIY